MAHNPPPGSAGPGSKSLPTWWTIVFFLVVLGVSWWQTRTSNLSPLPPTRTASPIDEGVIEPAHRPIPAEVTPEKNALPRDTSSSGQPGRETRAGTERQREGGDTNSTPNATLVKDQKIRDQDGTVIYSGTIDLGPTLARIARGEANSHRNDGTTFQNRERRLPAQPSGYYKEYVHPTPKTPGPGPQRVIVGNDGDIWYTPDHYRTFRRIQ